MADESRRSSASSRADTPLLQASTAIAHADEILVADLNSQSPSPELVVGGPPSAPSPLELRAFAQQTPKTRYARPVDYHQLELVTPPNPNLLCRICMEPFVNPKRLLCEHTFCDICLNDYLRISVQPYDIPGAAVRCPTCRRELNRDQEPLGVSRIITNMLDELLVKCPNTKEGCAWQGQRGDVQDHVDFACDCRLVECAARNCAHSVMARNVDKGCLHQFVSCEFCDERLMKLDLEDHQLKTCNFRMDSCCFCEAPIVRRVMAFHHENLCPKAVIKCPAAEFGCDHKCPRDQIEEHTRDCTISRMLPFLQGLKTSNEELASENSQLRRQVFSLEQGLNALQAMVALPAGTTAEEVTGSAADLASANSITDVQHSELIAQQEALRNEVSRLNSVLAEVEARTSMQLHNEVLRINTDLARQEATLSAMRNQQQWLINARLQALAQIRANAANSTGNASANTTAGATASASGTATGSSSRALSAAAASSSSRPAGSLH